MAKSKSFFGLRRGSTKSLTFQVLKGKQITKDRVDQVSNPQTSLQMLQRVVFATVVNAAEKMAEIVTISQQGVTDPVESKRRFIAQNVKQLRTYAKSIMAGGDVTAVFAPKGNTQLIPNSYLISKGSLFIPAVLQPKTAAANGGASFASDDWGTPGKLPVLADGEYTVEELWNALFGLRAGDQVTFPQIYGGNGMDIRLLDGEGEEVDYTQFTQFYAPRMVLKTDMPATTVTISEAGAATVLASIKAALLSGINTDASWSDLAENFVDTITVDEYVSDAGLRLAVTDDYQEWVGLNNDDPLCALGCILSRKDASTGKWQYSTSQLVCCWKSTLLDSMYYGFRLANAIDTYRAGAASDGEGNFLQRGGEADIVPESFM